MASHTEGALPMALMVPTCPTRPLVPMPAPEGILLILKPSVATGPNTALATIGGIQIFGFLTILGICSMLVPKPWLSSPAQRFSLKLITAKPTICAQQPTVAAPAAKPLSDRAMAIAALEIGKVRIMPINTATTIPISKGCNSTAHIISAPISVIIAAIAGPINCATATPAISVTAGVAIMSTGVVLLTSLPHSAPTAAAIKQPTGPPSAAPAVPVATLAKSTSGGAFKA